MRKSMLSKTLALFGNVLIVLVAVAGCGEPTSRPEPEIGASPSATRVLRIPVEVQPDEDILDSAIACDPNENIHIAYLALVRDPRRPNHWLKGSLRYVCVAQDGSELSRSTIVASTGFPSDPSLLVSGRQVIVSFLLAGRAFVSVRDLAQSAWLTNPVSEDPGKMFERALLRQVSPDRLLLGASVDRDFFISRTPYPSVSRRIGFGNAIGNNAECRLRAIAVQPDASLILAFSLWTEGEGARVLLLEGSLDESMLVVSGRHMLEGELAESFDAGTTSEGQSGVPESGGPELALNESNLYVAYISKAHDGSHQILVARFSVSPLKLVDTIPLGRAEAGSFRHLAVGARDSLVIVGYQQLSDSGTWEQLVFGANPDYLGRQHALLLSADGGTRYAGFGPRLAWSPRRLLWSWSKNSGQGVESCLQVALIPR